METTSVAQTYETPIELDPAPGVGVEPSIAASIEATPTGIYLAAALATLDMHKLSGADRIAVLRAHQRMASHYTAKTYQAMTAVADAVADEGDHPFDTAFEGATAEVRVALNLTRRAADTEFAFAHHLRTRLPSVAHMLEQGLIDVRRAKAIDHTTSHLSVTSARSVVERIAPVASELTTGQIMARIRKLAIEASPDEAADRYKRAVSDRRVVMEPTVDGTAHLHAFDLPPDRAAAIRKHIHRIATSLRGEDESRTMDQLRADVFIDLLLGRTSVSGSEASRSASGKRGTVDIRVDLDTLVGLADHPGELAGYGPVVSDVARRVLDENHESEWRVTVVETDSNRTLRTMTTSRRPNRSQTRLIETRDQNCVFPGCRMAATECDLDHIEAWSDGGNTHPDNLAPLCRHDHRLKHALRWRYKIDEEGRHVWTTALGQTIVNPRDPP